MTGKTTVTFTCGSLKKNIDVYPADYASTFKLDVTQDAANKDVLKITVTHGKGETTTVGNVVEYYIAGLIPAQTSSSVPAFFNVDRWFMMTPKSFTSGNALEWMYPMLPSINLYAAKKFTWASDSKQEQILEVPLGFSKADVKPFGVQVHFFYRIGDNLVKIGGEGDNGIIWDATK